MMNIEMKGPTFNYHEFINSVEELVRDGKTSGQNQSERLSEFTALNLKRMKRIDKTMRVLDELKPLLKELDQKQEWLVITEAWCGDSAQSLPVIARIADESGEKIDLKIILRDENPELMDRYLTNGSKAIPKLVAFDEKGNELFTWGARPIPAQKLLQDWKQNPKGRDRDDFDNELHTWYAKDKSQTIQQEFVELIRQSIA